MDPQGTAQPRVRRTHSTRPADNEDVDRRDRSPVQSKAFTDDAFDPISIDGTACALARYSQTDARLAATVRASHDCEEGVAECDRLRENPTKGGRPV